MRKVSMLNRLDREERPFTVQNVLRESLSFEIHIDSLLRMQSKPTVSLTCSTKEFASLEAPP